MSKVAFVRVQEVEERVTKAVLKALELIEWRDYLKGKRVFVKVNLISSEFVPGQCTSPLILDEVLRVLSQEGYDITVGDADLAAAKQCDKASKVWGHRMLAEKYGAKFQNLSNDETVEMDLGGKVLKNLEIPKSIAKCDSIVSLPVMKTHCLTTVTCALKQFWGVVPRLRHQYHVVVDDAIADINTFLSGRVAFALVDGTIGMEGNGPRTGIPKVTDVLMASHDLVALDTAVADYMRLPRPTHVDRAAERGLGTTNYVLVGDQFSVNRFLPANPTQQPIFRWEMYFRNSFLKPLLFDTFAFEILAYIATKYNTFWYYRTRGKKYARRLSDNYYVTMIQRHYGIAI